MPGGSKYRAQLHRGGLMLAEMRLLLEAFSEHGSLDRLAKQALDDNILRKNSDRTIGENMSAFRRRFTDTGSLPDGQLAGCAVRSRMNDAAKTQLLLPYYVRSDLLADRLYRELVLSRIGLPYATLSTAEVADYVAKLASSHTELKAWSEYLRFRWAAAFLRMLRGFGMMEPHPRTRLRRLWLLPEPFAFFWFWFWERDGSYWYAYRNDLWDLLQLDDQGKHDLLTEGNLRGWWNYQRLGDITNFQSKFRSTREWLENGLA